MNIALIGSGGREHVLCRKLKDSKKINNDLDWKTKLNFDEGLEKTIQWYLDNPEIINNISNTALDSTPWKSSN